MKKRQYFYIALIALFSLICIVYILYLTQRVTFTKTRISMKDAKKTVWDFYKASQNGDTKLYLKCFTPKSSKMIETSIKKLGKEEFSRYIIQMMANINALTIKAPDIIETNNDRFNITVEVVLDTRQEDYIFYMEKTKSGWKIDTVSNPAFITPPDSYGTRFK